MSARGLPPDDPVGSQARPGGRGNAPESSTLLDEPLFEDSETDASGQEMLPPSRRRLPDVELDGSTVAALHDEAPLPPSSRRSQPPPGPRSPPRSIAPDPTTGDRIGEFDLLELLGKGGAGSVYKVRRASNGEIVALKVLAASKLTRQRVVQRFFDEARTASLVKHQNLVNLIEFIEEDEPRRLAYAMEFVDGVSLRGKLQTERSLPMTVAIDIARQICEGVGALHEAGIIHRDLKPENIMLVDLPDGRPMVKVLDFGVAKFLTIDRLTGGSQSEGPGTFVGTPRYMAPEQAAGGSVDGRSDLFAVGVMLFEMITGSRPHEGDSLKAVVMAKLKGAPRITKNPNHEVIPQELSDVVDSCLKLQPDLRPTDAESVITVLTDAYTVLSAVGSIRIRPDGGWEREETSSTDGHDDELLVPSDMSESDFGPQRQTATYVLGAAVSDNLSVPPEPAPRPVIAAHSIAPAPHSLPPRPAPTLPPPEPEAKVSMPQALRTSLIFAVIGAVAIGAAAVAYKFVADDSMVLVTTPEVKPVVDPFIEEHEVELKTRPAGASVIIDGAVVGTSPRTILLRSGIEGIELQFKLDGYQDGRARITRETPASFAVELEAVADQPPDTIEPESEPEPAVAPPPPPPSPSRLEAPPPPPRTRRVRPPPPPEPKAERVVPPPPPPRFRLKKKPPPPPPPAARDDGYDEEGPDDEPDDELEPADELPE